MAPRNRNKWLECLFLGLLCLSPARLTADIIDDINQLEPKKDKQNPKNQQSKPDSSKPDSDANPDEQLKAVGPEPKPSAKGQGPDKSKDKKTQDRPRRDAPIHLASEVCCDHDDSMAHLSC